MAEENVSAGTVASDSTRSPVSRAEILLDQLGRNLEGVRQKAASVAADGAGTRSTAASVGTPNERAEELLTQFGERLGRWTSDSYRQLRKTAALAREEAEDIWAEAQALRHNHTTETTVSSSAETETQP